MRFHLPSSGRVVMSCVQAELQLTNGEDLALLRCGHLTPTEVRSLRVKAWADRDTFPLVIPDRLRHQLGIPVIDNRLIELADGSLTEVEMVGPVEIRFANRRFTCDAMVLADADAVSLGVVPMNGLNVVIDPQQRELIVNPQHPRRSRFFTPPHFTVPGAGSISLGAKLIRLNAAPTSVKVTRGELFSAPATSKPRSV